MADQGGFPLSPQQRRAWALLATGPATTFRVQGAVCLRGALDSAQLDAALEQLVARHEILRTTFPIASGMTAPLQVIQPQGAMRRATRDLSGLDPAVQEAKLDSLWQEGIAPFDLARGPLVEATLVRLGSQEHLLLLTASPLCVDAATLSRLTEELWQDYAASGNDKGAEEETLQYADIAAWQNELFDEEDNEEGVRFWAGVTSPPSLGLSFAHGDGPAAPRTVPVPLAADLPSDLESAAATSAATVADLLFAAWATLLWRLTDTTEIVVGASFAGRSYEGLEDTVGPLVRYLPLTIAPGEASTFAQLVDVLQATVEEADEWQELFAWERLSAVSSSDPPPSFDAGFEFAALPQSDEATGLRFTLARHRSWVEPFALKLSVQRGPEGLRADLDYDAGRTTCADAARLAEQFAVLLSDAVTRPQAPPASFALLSAAQRLEVLDHGSSAEDADAVCVHRLFEAWAQQTPDAVALVYEDQILSFGALNARANRLAHHLRALGVGPEVPVALDLDRSGEVIVALLAVFKAGGAFLPLDPGLPAERAAFLLRETAAPVVVRRSADNRPPLSGPKTVWLDAAVAPLAQYPADNLMNGVAPIHAAYVLYTSGSTGQPKGVVVEHRQLWSYVSGIRAQLALPPGTRYATVSTFAADLGHTTIFPALCGGGELHVVAQTRITDSARMASYMERRAIDCLKIVPSHLEALMAVPRPSRLMPRRWLIVGGEASRRSLLEEVRALAPAGCRILNHYGPTETTVGVLTHAAALTAHDRTPAVPIGRPLSRVQAYALDRQGEPLPLWVAGELYIGGASVARGYLGGPARTAGRFVPDPYSEAAGSRLYRTGDRVRRCPDGTFTFLGRVDDQVKIRGFRIEPGEIAAALGAHPEVRDVVVLAREDQPGRLQLVAYVVAAADSTPTPEALEQFAAAKLPTFMVPAAWVVLPALPLTPNGKLDRSRLPRPEQVRREAAFVAPRTPLETALAAVWAEVLGVARIGVRDNFFELGGDSIRSITVRGKALEQGIDVPVAELFAHPTIEALAVALEASEEAPARLVAAPFSLLTEADRHALPEGVEDAYPITLLQQGMLFHSAFHAGAATYHDIGSYRFRIDFDHDALRAALAVLVARHAVLRTSFDLTTFSEPVQLVWDRVVLPLAIEDLRLLPAARQEALVDAWIAAEALHSFDWKQAPLMRFHVHRLQDDVCQLSVSFHHAVLDGWSRHSMVSELIQHYLRHLGREVPEPVALPDLQFRHFVAAERETLQSEAARSFWTARLHGAVRTTVPRGSGEALPEVVPRVQYLPTPLAESVSAGLEEVARRVGVPVKSVLLAAHMRVLALLGGRPDVLTGLVTNGRPEEAGGERILGLFLNTVPLRLVVGGSWVELVERVFTAEREVMPYRRLPLAAVQRMVGGGPLVEVAFNYIHYHVYQELSDLEDIGFLGYKDFQETNFTLGVTFSQNPLSGHLTLGLEYDAWTLPEASIEAFARYYLAALESLASTPDAAALDAALLSTAERQQLLVTWNDTQVVHPQARCFHHLVAEQAASQPDAVAVVSPQGCLSYGELVRRSTLLARQLQARGVSPETFVALTAARSPAVLVGILGILEAGAAYVFLDPEHPAERLAFMLDETAAVAMVVSGSVAHEPTFSGPVLHLDAGGRLVTPTSAAAPAPDTAVNLDHLAYAIYTSGSTGRPKGVMIDHRGLHNLAAAQRPVFRLGPGDRILQVAPLSFDASVAEIVMTLGTGATLCLARRTALLPGPELTALLNSQRISFVTFPPSLLEQLPVAPLPSLGTLAVAGEACAGTLVQGWAPGRRFLNLYGPTETTVWASHAVCLPDPGPPSVGRPIANTRMYLLDGRLQPVPVGVPGEVGIAGVGLARGYLARPGLTAERFVPEPFAAQPGERLYRSGDLGRFLKDGRIALLGRIDHQVKVRGHRVEPGEIEAAMRGLEDIATAVAVARRGEAGEASLVVYAVPAANCAPSVADLRVALKTRLPVYMLPSHIVLLDALPLTPNGKVDRGALPAPGGTRPLLEHPYAAPRTPVEEILCGLFATLLGVEQVGIHDDFFELGGHSLIATRLVSRLRQDCSVELPLAALFEAPTVADLSGRVEVAMTADHGLVAPPITPQPTAGTATLSFAQERLWFLDQLEPESPAYGIPSALRFEGPLAVTVLRAALTEIARRHEVLRTTFSAAADGTPRQVIAPPRPFALPIVDLQALPVSVRELEGRRLATAEARRPFDLHCGPLLRVTLLRSAPGDHVLLYTMHHIISDGWSMGILVGETSTLYRAYSAGRPSPLAALPVQYADFAIWQRDWLRDAALTAQLDYWRRQLDGAPTLLELPADRPRAAIQGHAGARLSFHVDAAVGGALATLGRRRGATLFMMLTAAFQTLLGRLSGQAKVCLGTPIAGRNRAETEGLIGFFVNTLVLAADVGGDPRFVTLLDQVRQQVLGAHAHQDLPFEKLVEALEPERSLAHAPLFQVMFSFQNAPLEAEPLPDLRLTPVDVTTGTAKFDLELWVGLREGGALVGGAEYDTGLFDATTIGRLLDGYVHLLAAIAAAPERTLSALSPLQPAVRHQLLHEWNDSACRFTPAPFFRTLFEARAARAPEAIAAVCAEQWLTYGVLDRRADHLARGLAAHGLQADTPVAILSSRGIPFLTAVLATLKHGAAYLPLDPLHPASRLRRILVGSGVEMVLATDEFRAVLRQALDDGPPVRVLSLEALLATSATVRPAALPLPLSPRHLAYLIYTSGSTGTPKGAMVEQRGMLNHLHAKVRDLQLTAGDSVAQNASQCFDISVWQMLAPLVVGGRVHIVTDDTARDPSLLIAEVERGRVTVLETVPSLLRILLEGLSAQGGERPALGALRWLIPTGEALPPELCRDWFALRAGVPLLNAYGPTECSDDVTHHVLTGSLPADTVYTPIGRPVANLEIYVLDRALRLQPPGAVGELAVGGVGVGRGYLGAPARTAMVFVPDPLSPQPGARLYKSGDLVRAHRDGTLVFIGRFDNQVKVRGFRIELGEIESALGHHPEVADCAVVALGESPADRRLVAYLIPEQADAAPATASLQAFLESRLPAYMVPSAFVALSSFPLNANGKLDRRALPAPVRLDTAPIAGAAPRTPTEQLLAGAWAEVLGHEAIARSDSFFALGGHSLLATQLLSRVRTLLGVEMPLRTLFDTPVLRDFAARVDEEARRGRGFEDDPITPAPRQQAPPLSFAQARLWFLDQLDPGRATYNLSSAVRLRGVLDVAALWASFSALLHRHEILRTTYFAIDGVPRQRIAPPAQAVVAEIDLSALPVALRQKVARRLAAHAATVPFDLTSGPLLRFGLLRLATDEHLLYTTVHHIACDGWSLGLMHGEIAQLYSALAARRPTPLAPLSVQYADYAYWQRRWLQGDVLARQLGYWREQLAGLAPVLELPTDRPRPAVQRFRGDRLVFQLPAMLSDALQALGRKQGSTLFMTLLAAFQTLLHRYTGEADIAVGSPIAGRTRVETEALIGFFVNTLVLRGDLMGDPSFAVLLERVREMSLGAHAHQDLPFDKLVEELRPERSLAYSPLFQVLFVMQNATPREEAAGGALVMEPLETSIGAARFDLVMDILEGTAGLRVRLDYDLDLFDTATVQRLYRHFARLLQGIVDAPEWPISALPLLATAESQQLLVDWGRNPVPLDETLTVHGLFARQVARDPEAVAVVAEGQRLTYRQLAALAGRLAARLTALGVGPEMRVGLAVERAPEMVWGLLGILQAGAAYVPLDPDYPQERLAFLVADAGLRLLVTQERLVATLPAGGVEILCLEQVAAEGDDVNAAGERVLWPRHLAYTIYTSGSTGRPKGSLIDHRGVVNMLLWRQRCFPLSPADRVLQTDAFSFDAAGWQFYWPLIAGARLVLTRPGGNRESNYLVRLMADEGITVVGFVPSMLRVILDEAELARCRGLRHLFCGGELLSRDLVERFFARLPETALHNVYGPTEAAIDLTDSTYRRLTDIGAQSAAPIGRPIGNKEIYVLDRDGRPVPAGHPGELFGGGVGLARGYLGRPGLTAASFIPDPFAPRAGARLYRTGDLVRYLGDGALAFLGRIDNQVKVRGFRIELGEIEAALGEHLAVAENIVVVHEDGGIKRLVAYWVAAEGAVVPGAGALRDFLQAKLPQHMVPAFFLCLPALPLNPNGKVDRRALPAPDEGRPELEAEFIAPRDAVEAQLAGIWSAVLGVERVGVDDNFFDLGGDSILSIQIVARANRAGLGLSARDVFQHQTVAALAVQALAGRRRSAEQGVVTGSAPLTPIQRWLFAQDNDTPHHFNQSLLLEVREPLATHHLRAACARLLAHHDVLRLRFARQDQDWGQRFVVPGGAPPFTVIDLTAVPASRRSPRLEAAAAQLQTSLDLATGPLTRLALFDLGVEEADRLLWIIHHLAVDGVSWRILLEDLETAYRQLAGGEEASLPPKTTSFKAWAERLAAHASSAPMRRELDFWLSQVPIGLVPLPREPVAGESAATRAAVSHTLDAAATRSLLEEVPRVYRTHIHEVLLTALAEAFRDWTGQDRLLVDLEGHGREEIFDDVDLSRTVGWFTTLAPLLLDLTDCDMPGAMLTAVKEQVRRLPERGLGYGLLRFMGGDEAAAALASRPRPEVVFNYLGQLDHALGGPSPFVAAKESSGAEQSPAAGRSHRLEVIASVVGGCLRLTIVYGHDTDRRAVVETLAAGVIGALERLIAHCQSPVAGAQSPEDFPLAELDTDQLAKIAGLVEALDEAEELAT